MTPFVGFSVTVYALIAFFFRNSSNSLEKVIFAGSIVFIIAFAASTVHGAINYWLVWASLSASIFMLTIWKRSDLLNQLFWYVWAAMVAVHSYIAINMLY